MRCFKLISKIKKKRIILTSLLILETLTIILFSVLLVLYILSKVNIGYVIILFLILLVEILMTFITFAQLTNFYPINNVNGKTYDNISKRYLTAKKISLNLYEAEKGIWIIDDKFCFDMRCYVFPKLYICSYFIRNIHYPIINRNKLRLSALFKSQFTDRFEELKIIFHSHNNIKECFVVKNSKTKVFPLKGLIILSLLS